MRRLLVIGAALLAGAVPAHAAAPPDVALAAYVIADGRDGRVLAQRNADEPRAIASITKMMTAYLALQAGALDPHVHGARGGDDRSASRPPGCTPGIGVTGRDLLEGLLVPSANDAAETLAIGIDGSESAFVRG